MGPRDENPVTAPTARTPAAIRREQRAWAAASIQRYYRNHRRKPSELYPSERFFLPEVLPRVDSCLDVGCAAGGFYPIMKSYNPRVRYTGVDINPDFVRAARRRYPTARFVEGDGVRFDTPANSHDLVHLSGVLHLNTGYAKMLKAAYRQARRFVLTDFRLTRGPAVRGTFPLDPARPALPYLVLNLKRWLAELKALRPAPARLVVRGYPHAPATGAVVPLKSVIVAFVLIEKGSGRSRTRVDVDVDAAPPADPAGRKS